MAEVLNKFFGSVFTKEDTSYFPNTENFKSNSSLPDIIFTRKDIKEKLDRLKPTPAPGPDSLSPYFLKEFANYLCEPLALIFTMSFNTGIVPQQWRTANVTPIFKKGSKSNPGNYRPVSLTCVVCKIMESIIKDKITDHLITNNLILKSQHGFMKRRSCLTNLLEYLENLKELVDNGNSVDVLYLDFSKAFDKVPHERRSTTESIGDTWNNWKDKELDWSVAKWS